MHFKQFLSKVPLEQQKTYYYFYDESRSETSNAKNI